MKIYRKLTIDIQTGETLEEDSCEYSGPVAECKGQENKIFTQQQGQSFGNMGNVGNSQMNLFNSLNGMLSQRFGAQSQNFGILQNNLQNVLGRGTGMNFLRNQFGGHGGGIYFRTAAGGREGAFTFSLTHSGNPSADDTQGFSFLINDAGAGPSPASLAMSVTDATDADKTKKIYMTRDVG